jgi:hypothetical protein
VYLVFSPLLERPISWKNFTIAIIVGAFYGMMCAVPAAWINIAHIGSIIVGVFRKHPRISWELHVTGAASGAIASIG